MKKRFIRIIVTVTVLMMVAWAAWTGNAEAGPVVLKLATVEPPQSFNVKDAWTPIINKINKEGEGILKIEVFAGGTLGRNPMQLMKTLMDGVTDICHIINAYLPGQLKDDQVINMPFMAKNSSDCSLAFQYMQEKNLQLHQR